MSEHRDSIIAAPLWVEWLALKGAARTRVVCTGMGPRRSQRSARRFGGAAVLVAGVGGGLAPHVRVGDLVVGSEVRAPDGTVVPCPASLPLAVALQQAGLQVHYGPIVCSTGLAGGAARQRLAGTGALAVDMESAWLAPEAGTPFAVVRAISDTTDRPLLPAVVAGGLTALRALRRAAPTLDRWAEDVTEPDRTEPKGVS